MSSTLFNSIALVLIFISALLGGAISESRFAHPSKNGFVYYGEAFAAGIFLGASLLHMLPDAVANLTAQTSIWRYPLSLIFCSMGFFIMQLIATLGDTVHLKNHATEAPTSHAGVAYMLLIILSFHSILVGITLGLEGRLFAAVIILTAILVHKTSAGFALGLSLRRSLSKVGIRWAFLILFALATPFGVMLGLMMKAYFHTSLSLLAEGLFDAVAAGTFLFMAMHLSQGNSHIGDDMRIRSVGVAIVGFILMGVLSWLV